MLCQDGKCVINIAMCVTCYYKITNILHGIEISDVKSVEDFVER